MSTPDGELAYDALLIATGATPVTLPGLPHAQALRTLEDALELAAHLEPGARIAVVGAGLIGQEIASAAAARGAHATLIDVATRPFDALLGPGQGDWLRARHEQAGVRLLLGRRLTATRRRRARSSTTAPASRPTARSSRSGSGPTSGGPALARDPRRRVAFGRARRGRLHRQRALGGRRPPGPRSRARDPRPPAETGSAPAGVERSARRADPAPRRPGRRRRGPPRGDRDRVRAHLHASGTPGRIHARQPPGRRRRRAARPSEPQPKEAA